MTAKGWEEILRTLDEDGIRRMAILLEQIDEVREILYRKGYGETGSSILEMVKEVPE
jgi:hypothetical protein